jgi:hypothetical protein
LDATIVRHVQRQIESDEEKSVTNSVVGLSLRGSVVTAAGRETTNKLSREFHFNSACSEGHINATCGREKKDFHTVLI